VFHYFGKGLLIFSEKFVVSNVLLYICFQSASLIQNGVTSVIAPLHSEEQKGIKQPALRTFKVA
jgi:hypothetical protein